MKLENYYESLKVKGREPSSYVCSLSGTLRSPLASRPNDLQPSRAVAHMGLETLYLLMQTLRLSRVKELVQGHTVKKQWSLAWPTGAGGGGGYLHSFVLSSKPPLTIVTVGTIPVR